MLQASIIYLSLGSRSRRSKSSVQSGLFDFTCSRFRHPRHQPQVETALGGHWWYLSDVTSPVPCPATHHLPNRHPSSVIQTDIGPRQNSSSNAIIEKEGIRSNARWRRGPVPHVAAAAIVIAIVIRRGSVGAFQPYHRYGAAAGSGEDGVPGKAAASACPFRRNCTSPRLPARTEEGDGGGPD